MKVNDYEMKGMSIRWLMTHDSMTLYMLNNDHESMTITIELEHAYSIIDPSTVYKSELNDKNLYYGGVSWSVHCKTAFIMLYFTKFDLNSVSE